MAKNKFHKLQRCKYLDCNVMFTYKLPVIAILMLP